MTEIELVLTWPPTVNSYYVRTRNGIFVSKRGNQFRKEVAVDVREQLNVWDTLDEPLNVEVVLYPPDKLKRDLDNHMKGLLDALTHCGLWADDALIDQLSILRGVVIPSGKCVVRIVEGGPIVPADRA